jgi:ribonuclease P protein component
MQDKKHQETFSKEERLKSRKIISQMIESGQSVAAYPLRLVWFPVALPTSNFRAQVAFAVSKKNFAHAVDRNKIKRQLREIYRKNKHSLYPLLEKKSCTVALLLIFTGKEKPDYSDLEKKLIRLLNKLNEAI